MAVRVLGKEEKLELESPRPKILAQLRLLVDDDRQRIVTWLKDPYLVQLTFIVPGPNYSDRVSFSDEAAHRYFETLIQDPKRKTFAMVLNGLHMGTLGLKAIDMNLLKCECFIEVGEPTLRGRGVGTAAMSMMLDYAFSELGLNEVNLDVLEFNLPAIAVYEKLGFEHKGRVGWHYDIENNYRQVLGMNLSRETWLLVRQDLKLSGELELLGVQE